MPEHADTLHNFIESTRKWYSFLSGVVSSLILSHYSSVVGSSSGSAAKLVAERDLHSAVTALMDPIDISSSSESDSDWDIDGIKALYESPQREHTASVDSRVLPSWATAPGTSSREPDASPPRRSAASANLTILPTRTSPISTNSMGYAGPSRKVPSSKTNGTSYGVNNHTQAKHQMHLTGTDHVRALNSRAAQDDGFKHSTWNDYGKNSSQQTSKRTLPTSLQPSVSSVWPNNLVENVGGSRENHGKSNYSAWPTLTNDKNYMKDHLGKGTDDEVVMYDNSGNRVLPPSLMHGRYVSNTHYVNPSDPSYRPGVGEERSVGTDETLIYQAALQDLNQPKVEVNLPDGLLSVSLLRHQKIALAWMLQKETRSLHCLGGILADDQGLGKTISMIALIQIQRSLQSKSKSEDLCKHKTEPLNLDDDDDNGSAALDKSKQIGESVESKSITEVSTSVREFRRRRPASGTLVVCPASVLRQWARELDEKVADEAKLSVLIYHGGNRTKDPDELAKYDVVLTTYAIVTNEVPKQPLVDEDDEDQKKMDKSGVSSEFSTNKKRKKPSSVNKKGKKGRKGIDSSAFDYDCGTLARVGWFRVILDEAQTIKNHRTQVARACCGLRAKRRWCLSGTPIQNAIDELFSYFRFLRYDPYASYKSFCNTIKNPISRNSIHGYKKLQAVLRAIMLRRTKDTFIDGEPIINLPPKTIHLKKVDFPPEERAFYNKLEAESRSQFKAYAAAGTLNQNYANILLMLLRLRQACDHPLLVKGFNWEPVKRVSTEMARKLPREKLINLLHLLETSLAICRSCNDPPEDAIVTMCGHVFCYQCVSDSLTGDDNTCPDPKCKEQLGSDVIFSKATLRSCISGDLGSDSMGSSSEKPVVLQNEFSSSKIRAALEILQTHCRLKNPSTELHNLIRCNGNSSSLGNASSGSQTEGPTKAIVFSQWTSMLNLLEIALNQSGLQYRRLDGTMSLALRDKNVKEFNTDPEVTVMLMSLKAGNLGLNMVAACHVILLDLWWNPTTEDQAIDRAHRIGQTRPVTVSRLTVKDTVEDRILALQEEKRKMVASAFGEDHSGGSGTRLTVEDLKYLFMGPQSSAFGLS